MRHFSQNKKRQLPPPRPIANPFAQFRSPSPEDGGLGGTNKPKQKPKPPHTYAKPGPAAATLPRPQPPPRTEDENGEIGDIPNEERESKQDDDDDNDKEAEEEEEEEDYLTMALPTTTTTSSSTAGETSLQRRQRLAKEGLARGRIPSKAELAAQERQRREEGLARSLFFDQPRREEDEVIRVGGGGGSSANAATTAVNAAGGAAPVSKSKGLAMMAKMGFRPGERLGAVRKGDGAGDVDKVEDGKAQGQNPGQKDQSNHAITEPIRIHIREDRGGIGLEGERKRKLQEAADALGLNNDPNVTTTTGPSNTNKKAKIEDEADYRVRMARERDAARKEKLVTAAQKIAERMDEDGDEGGEGDGDMGSGRNKKGAAAAATAARPLTSIPIVYRALVRNREQAERERRMRHDLETSLGTSTSTTTRHSSSKLPTYQEDEDTFDSYDRIALGKDDDEGQGLKTQVDGGDDDGKQQKVAANVYMPADDLDDEDTELEKFEALDVGERLAKLVAYLRAKYRYCFWCKFAYPDKEMEGCPGPEEEDHD